jgi:quercetin dioxygenase-like cupin family protein
MVEKVNTFSRGDERVVENVVNTDAAQIMHMIFPKDAGLPEHASNTNVYMIVVRGTVSIRLNNQEEKKYQAGSLLEVPYNTLMNVNNKDEEVLELFVVKAPHPNKYEEK